ncbi:MAG: hypothetical protein CMK46_06875 [Porticoccus sp.]|jgi:hypothetical protein|uniref:hypothetical protein n=1 Tax=Pseudomonadota TaxID=1224 RepID=UPI000C48CD79|nr:hypothetical protein [Rhodospirillaceae bacterium]MBG57997.1 hypothetical protein [Porticoccus sp.]QDP49898.1 MAG: hypothetical protein GOVbin132_42 [Prokaryotic dsDNA virus sp.]MAX61604.1 hypothetical protein [Rhodospirillaceae bacterium]MAX61669.1 hypothetical protein [Rhodospirillaceae bacterium]|tara:strand:+ start:41534 stop:41935 length:402 start_codon:yes stop_codon:yes gene_type:complete
MTAFLIIFGPFLLLHLLSWTPMPEKVPVRRKDLGGKNGGRVMGRSSLFWVWAHPQADAATIAHERQHVRDKWRLMWLGYLILSNAQWFKEWREARGYAVSVQHGRSIESAAAGMAAGVKISPERARKLIEARL